MFPIGVLIENTSGKLPLWLAPIQIIVTNIAEDSSKYAEEIYKSCIHKNLRTELDLRNEKISYKIREHSNRKIPIIFTVGKNEMRDNSVSIRRLGSNNQEILPYKKAIAEIQNVAYMP